MHCPFHTLSPVPQRPRRAEPKTKKKPSTEEQRERLGVSDGHGLNQGSVRRQLICRLCSGLFPQSRRARPPLKPQFVPGSKSKQGEVPFGARPRAAGTLARPGHSAGGASRRFPIPATQAPAGSIREPQGAVHPDRRVGPAVRPTACCRSLRFRRATIPPLASTPRS